MVAHKNTSLSVITEENTPCLTYSYLEWKMSPAYLAVCLAGCNHRGRGWQPMSHQTSSLPSGWQHQVQSRQELLLGLQHCSQDLISLCGLLWTSLGSRWRRGTRNPQSPWDHGAGWDLAEPPVSQLVLCRPSWLMCHLILMTVSEKIILIKFQNNKK